MINKTTRAAIFEPIGKELDLVEKIWESCFVEATNRTHKQINGFFRNSTGKRLRPALTILAARAVLQKSSPKKDQINLLNVAAAIELLHTASLIHDDTIDGALIRHHHPTINAKFGSHVSIAFGDFVYSWALKLISAVSDPIIFDCFAKKTFDLCEGELTQITERQNLEMSPRRYFSIIKKKTAALFALSGETGVLVADRGNIQDSRVMREFGLNFGIAYQIIDDLRDLVSDQRKLGKEPGADFHVAELTLPMIYLLKDPKVGARVKRLYQSNDKEKSFEKIRQIAVNSAAINKTRAKAVHFLGKTRSSVSTITDSQYKDHLLALVDWLAEKL